MKITILTLFPQMFEPVLNDSIMGRAVEKNILEFDVVNIRDFTLDKHRSVDDTPFGGGAGMVMSAQPVFHALDSVAAKSKKVFYMSPRGKIIDKNKIDEFASMKEMIIICGHYEGLDQRVLDYYDVEEVSIGDYILTGGELPAMVLIDAVARMVPGVLGSQDAHNEESVYSGLLEYPQYTKPRCYEDLEVPEVLVSGNHKKIYLWNYEESLKLTAERRPDLLQKYLETPRKYTKDEIKILERLNHNYICVTEE